jgi:hypothetical protein
MPNIRTQFYEIVRVMWPSHPRDRHKGGLAGWSAFISLTCLVTSVLAFAHLSLLGPVMLVGAVWIGHEAYLKYQAENWP